MIQLRELLENSKRSDRDRARILGAVSADSVMSQKQRSSCREAGNEGCG